MQEVFHIFTVHQSEGQWMDRALATPLNLNSLDPKPESLIQGTDEHGQKIAQTAEGLGVKPIDICDKYANAFQELNKRMGISNDFYIRTTMQKHKV